MTAVRRDTFSIVRDMLTFPLGGGPLGHPKIFINLVRRTLSHQYDCHADHHSQDKPGPRPCG